MAERADGTGLVYRGPLTYRRDSSGALALEGVPFSAGRLTPDPLGEKYYELSPYAYCAGG